MVVTVSAITMNYMLDKNYPAVFELGLVFVVVSVY